MITATLSVTIGILLITNSLCLYGFYKLMKINIETEEGSTALHDELTSFRNHLDSVYNKDTFYGDETLKSLLSHAKDIEEYVGDFIIDSSLPENNFIQEMGLEDGTAETETQAAEEN